MTGRPTKFTPETVQKLIQAIQMGATYELACQYAAITIDTMNNWMKKSKTAKENDPFFGFFDSVKEAEGKAVVGWLAKIEKAANDGSWQAAAWKLERRYPRQYGKTVVENHNRDLNKLSDDELRAIAEGKD